MGRWTDILLSMAVMEDQDDEGTRIAEVNAYFKTEHANSFDRPLEKVKQIGGEVYAGTYKSFDLDAFLQYVNGIKWTDPENVQVFIKLDEDQQFKIVKGVQAYDNRFEDRDRLLVDAEYVIEELSKSAHSDTDALEWLAEYKKFRESEE